ncbi:regulator of phospholipase D Srf1p [[Candida] anglica]|uniref:Regulator of phospholipase D Srf1p n=1 Tax=[Candida] anglica TaxID=148631 RepID=A0ABP0ECY5_9ASCO
MSEKLEDHVGPLDPLERLELSTRPEEDKVVDKEENKIKEKSANGEEETKVEPSRTVDLGISTEHVVDPDRQPRRKHPRHIRAAIDKAKSSHSSSRSPFEDPYDTMVKTYSHRPNIVPPYVLDKLSQVHYRDQLNNSNVNNPESDQISTHHRSVHSKKSHNNDEEYQSFANDPFIKSLDNNWHNFLATVRQPTAYTSDMVAYDNKFNSDWNLEGGWGGEDRLKHALLGTSSSDDGTYDKEEKSGWWPFKNRNRGPSAGLNLELNEPSPRVRSKAGYWMSGEKRADLKPTLKRIFLQNPLIPLFLRILTIIFSTLALALAGSIFVLSSHEYDDTKIVQQPSTIMAICVQCFAIIYVVYIAYDEYHGKPLGLRDPVEKMKLIMLDLLFIIFSSANLSLAFNTLYDHEWVCMNDNNPDLATIGIFYPTVGSICRRQRALSAFLFIALCLWVVTFTISIVRVVDRVSTTPRSD